MNMFCIACLLLPVIHTKHTFAARAHTRHVFQVQNFMVLDIVKESIQAHRMAFIGIYIERERHTHNSTPYIRMNAFYSMGYVNAVSVGYSKGWCCCCCINVNVLCMHRQWYFYRFVMPSYASFLAYFFLFISLPPSLVDDSSFLCGYSVPCRLFFSHSFRFFYVTHFFFISSFLLFAVQYVRDLCNGHTSSSHVFFLWCL